MKNNLVLIAILSTVTTIGGTIVFHLDRQSKLAEEAAAQKQKEYMKQQVEILTNKEDNQKTRDMLLNRYRIPTSQNLTPEEKEAQERARKLNEGFRDAYNKETGRDAKSKSTPTPNNVKPTITPTPNN